MRHHHPANKARHDERGAGDKAADKVTCAMGSWGFIGVQTVLIVVWIGFNIVAYTQHFDPYPFILLNLAFSTQAAFASPLILLAANRSSEHDRARAEEDYRTNAETLRVLRGLHHILDEGGRVGGAS